MNYKQLEDAVKAVIKENGNEEITGEILQAVLLTMIRSLGKGYQFMGVAAPDTDPGIPDQKVFYIASVPKEEELEFIHFGPGFSLTGEMGVFWFDTEWHYQTLLDYFSLEQPFMLRVTWAELKALRDAGELTPGMRYRITDYVATTTQSGTRSANHPFDIIVVADSANTLNENASAIQHEGDEYFANSDLAAWKLKYCLDNDVTRFVWAQPKSILESGLGVVLYRTPSEDISSSGLFAWVNPSEGITYTKTEDPVIGTECYDDTGEPSGGEVTEVYSVGKGVIFKMTDEFDNEAPFDFKGIQFVRTADWFAGHEAWAETNLGSVPETDQWYYLLTWVNEDGEVEDLSIVAPTLLSDEGATMGCYGNHFGVVSAYSTGVIEDKFALALPTNVLLSSYNYEIGVFYGCYSNTFGNDCHSNTFGDVCHSNTFGDVCHSNTFGAGCFSNIYGDGCYSNTFGNDCHSNTFGNDCHSNTFGDVCHSNTFGNTCYSDTFETPNFVQYCTVCSNTQGKEIPFVANKDYAQIAGLDSNGGLVVRAIMD